MSRILSACDELDLFDPDDEELIVDAEYDDEPDEEDEHRATVVNLLTAIAASLSGMKALLQTLGAEQKNTVNAVHQMHKTVSEDKPSDDRELDAIMNLQASVHELAATMAAPKELVRDADGKPVGVRIKGT